MLERLKNWWSAPARPIGVDFGSECLKLAQTLVRHEEPRLIAAASADVPVEARGNTKERMAFYGESLRALIAQGGFQRRHAVLGLPAFCTQIMHLCLPKMDEASLKRAVAMEAANRLAIDPSNAIIRHFISAERNEGSETLQEIIVLAADHDAIEPLLTAAARAKLEVVGMNVDPRAISDCFSHIYRRKSDSVVVNCFVEIGASSTRLFVTRGGELHVARAIDIGGEHLTRAVASALLIPTHDARMLRVKLAHQEPGMDEHRDRRLVHTEDGRESEDSSGSMALLNAGIAGGGRHRAAVAGPAVNPPVESPMSMEEVGRRPRLFDEPVVLSPSQQTHVAELACRETLNKIVEEVNECRRQYNRIFPRQMVDRLIFIGGEASHRRLCQYISRETGVPAQVGDPLVRMGRCCPLGIESGIDRRQPQPAWTIAIGLSLGTFQPSDE